MIDPGEFSERVNALPLGHRLLVSAPTKDQTFCTEASAFLLLDLNGAGMAQGWKWVIAWLKVEGFPGGLHAWLEDRDFVIDGWGDGDYFLVPRREYYEDLKVFKLAELGVKDARAFLEHYMEVLEGDSE